MTRLDYAAIRQRIPIRCVLLLIDYQPTQRQGPQWRGPCPLPGCSADASPDKSRERSFSVHVGRHVFRCFRCECSGNQLDLWAQVTGLTLHPATLDLCRLLAVTPIRLQIPQPPNPF
jgi:hypothetical protein